MSKKNLPNIPLYIGDWEKDCNVLSLRAEAAWLRIIFKMFTNGKQSTYKLPTNGLQNLWKVSITEVNEILQELIDFEICEIHTDGRFTQFTCRRFKKENDISEVRKGAVSSRKDRKKPLQTPYKEDTNDVQITDIDYENEIKNENENKGKGVVGEKPKTEIIYPFDSDIFHEQWQKWKNYKQAEFKFKFKSTESEQAQLTKLDNLSQHSEATAIAIIQESISSGWKGFYAIKTETNGKQHHSSGNKTGYTFDLNRAVTSATGGNK